MVSGTHFHIISIYGTHIAAKSRNVPAGVISESSTGVSCPMRNVPIHRAKPATDMASPRTFMGYISLSITHTTAQMEPAQQMM